MRLKFDFIDGTKHETNNVIRIEEIANRIYWYFPSEFYSDCHKDYIVKLEITMEEII